MPNAILNHVLGLHFLLQRSVSQPLDCSRQNVRYWVKWIVSLHSILCLKSCHLLGFVGVWIMQDFVGVCVSWNFYLPFFFLLALSIFIIFSHFAYHVLRWAPHWWERESVYACVGFDLLSSQDPLCSCTELYTSSAHLLHRGHPGLILYCFPRLELPKKSYVDSKLSENVCVLYSHWR